MATFVLIPGAGGAAWYWSRVVPLLAARGHVGVACDLPSGGDDADLDTYADACVAHLEADAEALREAGRSGLVVVAQSLGGFSAPVLADRLEADAVVLLNAMIPRPGETPGEWFATSGSDAARREMAEREGRIVWDGVDPEQDFLHDLPADILAEAARMGPPEQSGEILHRVARFDGWPDATAVVGAREDRFFPWEFQRRQARERLDREATGVPGGHLAALSRPRDVVDALVHVLS